MTPTDPNERARELAVALTNAAALDEDGDGIDIAAGLYGTHTTEWLRRTARALSHAAAVEVPAEVIQLRARQVRARDIADKDGRHFNAQGHDQAIAAIDACVAAYSTNPPPAPAAVAGGER